MKEFVASTKELSCPLQATPFLDEVKEKEKERIEKDGLGVLKVYSLAGTHIYNVALESSLTFSCAREMGYTHFDCEEVPIPQPVVSRDAQALALKKKRLAQSFSNINYEGLENAFRDTMLRPATPTRRSISTTRGGIRPPNW